MPVHYPCPRCSTPLLRHRTDHSGFLWGCPTCSGRAATLPVLRHLVEPAAVSSLWRTVLEHGHIGPLACPMCAKRMADLPFQAGELSIEVDACHFCHLIWFDAPELEQLPAKPPPEAPLEVRLPPEMRQRLAMAKVKEMAEEARRGEWHEEPDEPWKVIAALLGLPVEHETRSTAVPVVTWLAALACALVFGVSWWLGLDAVIKEWGFVPARASRHGCLTAVTSFFLHAGWAHLLGNLYFLASFGDDVEEHLGHLRFALLLGAAALGGVLVHGLLEPRQELPLVGASGGISGCILFYALQFPRARIGVLVWPLWLNLPAYAMLGLWVGWQTWIAWQQMHGLSQVSALGHFGGATVGLLAWLMERRRWR